MPELKLMDYMDNFKNCLQYEKPYCQPACPFHLDVNAFIEKIKKGRINSAFKDYRNAVGFPLIVSQICSQPCKDVCPMQGHGGAIELRCLEQAVISHATRTSPTSYNVPKRPGKIGIIGSGPAGLGALLRMATKKYETHIYEKTERIGGKLNDHPDAESFMDDIENQLHHEKYELHLNTEITNRSQLNEMDFDVVFVATGKDGNDLGLLSAANDAGEKYVMKDGNTAWFAGGSLIGDEGVFALASGLYMGQVLDAYLKTGYLNYSREEMTTAIVIDEDRINDVAVALPMDQVYSNEEMLAEAERCLQCQCNFCRTYEDLTTYYDKWPLRIKDEVFATSLEGTSEVKATPAKRLISTSNLTGIVKAVCPQSIDLDNLILAGRQKMHRLEKAPWAFYDFWLRDMDFADSEAASLMLTKEAHTEKRQSNESGYAFFPGCQLGASLPGIVDRTYEWLLARDNSINLLLRCCGAPAMWAGDNELHERSLTEITEQWKKMGKPILITACPTCRKQFQQLLPHIETISLYEYIDEHLGERTENLHYMDQAVYSIFDPCSTREDDKTRKAVRSIIKKLGISWEELPEQSNIQRCCSFGGQPAIANPNYVKYVTDKRIGESENPYITYCVNCRDAFSGNGKKTRHLMEMVLGTDSVPTAGVSERRENRILLKKNLLKKYRNEDMDDNRKTYDFTLIFPEIIKDEMNRERILEEEVYEVVEFMIKTNRSVMEPDTGVHSGYRKIGYMTYWVSYRETGVDNEYEITDVYSHRMEIELEAVWNGHKTETDV